MLSSETFQHLITFRERRAHSLILQRTVKFKIRKISPSYGYELRVHVRHETIVRKEQLRPRSITSIHSRHPCPIRDKLKSLKQRKFPHVWAGFSGGRKEWKLFKLKGSGEDRMSERFFPPVSSFAGDFFTLSACLVFLPLAMKVRAQLFSAPTSGSVEKNCEALKRVSLQK